jgi:16S rRNA (cytosine1402-N4)-methyltransferase
MIDNHIPVMVDEFLLNLSLKKNSVYVDCTLGRGGHLKALLESYPEVRVIAIDQDQEAIERCRNDLFFSSYSIDFFNCEFSKIANILDDLNIKEVDCFLFDLGLSSEQLSDCERGFSYRQDSFLDMRMDLRNKISAQEVINKFSFQQLADIFFNYGEEFNAKKISRKICSLREKEKILTTQQLVSAIVCVQKTKKKKHPARKVFQALRIFVNKELENLNQALKTIFPYLKKEGKIFVISYHSLEDRIVKEIFKEKEKNEGFKILTKKPLIPSQKEIFSNNRSRSAKMRIISR